MHPWPAQFAACMHVYKAQQPCTIAYQPIVRMRDIWLKIPYCGNQNNLVVSAGPVYLFEKPSTGYQP